MTGGVTTWQERAANVVSEVLGPAPLLALLIVQAGVPSGAWLPTAISLLTIAIAPYGAAILLARRGRVTDRFVGDRRQRMPILLGSVVLIVGGTAGIVALRAPAELIALSTCAIAALVVIAIITRFWKVSIHAAVAAFACGVQLAIFGAAGLPVFAAIVAVWWARLVLRAHTPLQLAAGSVIGCALAGAYALLLALGG